MITPAAPAPPVPPLLPAAPPAPPLPTEYEYVALSEVIVFSV